MQYDKIDKNRLPDIEVRGTKQPYKYEGGKMPLEQVVDSSKGNILLIGPMGQGKSVVLYSYWLEHLTDSIYVDMRSLYPSSTGSIKDYVNLHYGLEIDNCKGITFLLDSINEAPSGVSLTKEIKELCENNKIIVSGYSNERVKDIDFEVNCVLLELRDEQIKIECDEQLKKLIKNNQLYTMYEETPKTIKKTCYANEYELMDDWINFYVRAKYVKKCLKGDYKYNDEEIVELLKSSNIADFTLKSKLACAKKKWSAFCGLLVGRGTNGWFTFRTEHFEMCGISYEEFLDVVLNTPIVKYEERYGFEYFKWVDDIYYTYFKKTSIGERFNNLKDIHKDLFDIIMDKDNREPIILLDEQGKIISFEQVAIVPYKVNNIEKIYVVLKPIDKMEGVGEDEAFVSFLFRDKNGNTALRVEEDKSLSFKIFGKYYDLLEEAYASKGRIPDEFKKRKKDLAKQKASYAMKNGIGINGQTQRDLLEILLDENNREPIVLTNESGQQIAFEQAAIVPYDINDEEELLYAVLKPIDKMEGVGEDAAVVFLVVQDENDNTALRVEQDELRALEVFEKYYDLLEETGVSVDKLREKLRERKEELIKK